MREEVNWHFIFMRNEVFSDWIHDYQLIKMDSDWVLSIEYWYREGGEPPIATNTQTTIGSILHLFFFYTSSLQKNPVISARVRTSMNEALLISLDSNTVESKIFILRPWLRHHANGRKVAGSSHDEVIYFFQLIESFQQQYVPEVDSASNRSEYQEYSWGIKGGRRVRLNILPSSVNRLSRI
jgi:hypothetical protein